jgi:hypothetical protein
MALSKSAKYYRRNKKARERKKKTDTEINRRPEQVKKRVEANRARRQAKAKGKDVKGQDYDHATGGFVKTKTNRGRKGEGGRKKKYKRS